MKKMKYLRTWLVVALVITIIGSLTGGTVAWFTDNVESTGNKIEAGTLNIDMLLKRDGAWISLEENEETRVFDYDLWEPGYTQVETMTIINKGTLALEYMLNVNPGTDAKKGANGESLADVIDVYMTFGEKTPSSFSEISEANGWWKAGTLSKLIADEKGFTQGVMLPSNAEKGVADGTVLEPGKMQGFCTCTIALHMQEQAGNEYQGLNLGDLGFILKAKQAMYEEDSFDNTYDDGENWPTANDKPVIDDKPVSMMKELKGDDLTIYATGDWQGVTPFGERVYGDMTLDCGVVMSTTESDVTDSPYEKCYVDILLSCDKDIVPGMEITLAGHYDFLSLAESGHWLAAKVSNLNLPATQRVEVMQELFGNPMRYDEIVNKVKEFFCGVIADDSFDGATITMELCVYDEYDYDYENPEVIETYSFKF